MIGDSIAKGFWRTHLTDSTNCALFECILGTVSIGAQPKLHLATSIRNRCTNQNRRSGNSLPSGDGVTSMLGLTQRKLSATTTAASDSVAMPMIDARPCAA